MPELPEVETVRRGIEKHAGQHRIVKVEAQGHRTFRHNPDGAHSIRALLEGRTIEAVRRRGKYLWLELEDTTSVAVIHLGMSGSVLTATRRPRMVAHEHLRLHLQPQGYLRFIDPRTFGHVSVSERQGDVPTLLSHIAPDPFERAFEVENVVARIRRSRRPLKSLLLDQEIVSGIGNIYADEGLSRAHIPGWVRGQDISAQQARASVIAAKEAMAAALEVGGTSFDSLYVDVEGSPGYFARELRVYGRQGKPCRDCATTIDKVVIGGRSHFFCPSCQVHTVD